MILAHEKILPHVLIGRDASSFLLQPLLLRLFFRLLDDDLVVFALVQVALVALRTATAAVRAEVLAEVPVAFAVADVFATYVTHLIATDARELVAARGLDEGGVAARTDAFDG